MCGTKFYKIWKAMKGRCRNPKTNGYHNYGGRGITVCERWINFKNFKEDMLASYLEHVEKHGEDNTSIDRVNVNDHYHPENCKWSTLYEQNNNRRTTKRLEYKGESLPLKELSKRLGVSYSLISKRIHYGWSIEDAIERERVPKDFNRVVEQPQNNLPRKSSKYRGVSWCRFKKRWVAQITVNYKHILIGRYSTQLEAAQAYNDYKNSLRGVERV
jgi:hypothetical protein